MLTAYHDGQLPEIRKPGRTPFEVPGPVRAASEGLDRLVAA
jgi:hypothetical protein